MMSLKRRRLPLILTVVAVGVPVTWVSIQYYNPRTYRLESSRNPKHASIELKVNRVTGQLDGADVITKGKTTPLPSQWFRGIKCHTYKGAMRFTEGPRGRKYLGLISGPNEADAIVHVFLWTKSRLLYSYADGIMGWALPANLSSTGQITYFDLGMEETYEQALFDIFQVP